MSLKSELLKFLSRMPNTQTVRERKALLAILGFDGLGRKINWEGSDRVFFSELLELLCSEGQMNLCSFLKKLADRDLDWVGVENSDRLVTLAENVGALTTEQWDREFFGYSQSHSLLRVPFVLPQLDVSTFTGREEELKRLEQLLLNRQSSKICSIVGLSGGGGIGKSALACHFATIHRDKFPDGVIGLRVDGKDLDTIAREFVRRFGEELDAEDERDAATLMQEAFAHRQILLIFDNAVEASIKKLRPGGNRCAVIITTRNRNLSNSLDIPLEGAIDLDPLSKEKSLLLLKKILGDERVNSELEATYEIIDLVGNLPLGIQIAGAALRGRSRSLADYAASLQQEKTRLARLKVRGDDDLNIEASLNLSLELLNEEEKYFFACLSVCAEDGFSRETAMVVGGLEDEWITQDYLDRLYEYSLISYSEFKDSRFVLHPLVRLFSRNLADKSYSLNDIEARHGQYFISIVKLFYKSDAKISITISKELDEIILAAKWLLNQESISREQQKKKYKFIQLIMPFFDKYGYWEKASELIHSFQLIAEKNDDWKISVGLRIQEAKYLFFQRELQQAKTILESIPEILPRIEKESSRKRAEVAWLSLLSRVSGKQGQLDQAIRNLQDLIQISEALNEKSQLAIELNRLGGLLQQQGKLDEALAIARRCAAIEADQAKSGISRGLSIALTQVSKLLKETGQVEEAITRLQHVAYIEEELGNQQGLAMALTSLASLQKDLGYFDQAVDTLLRIVEIEEKFGNQASMSLALANLGYISIQQNNFELAIEYYERATNLSINFDDKELVASLLTRLGITLHQYGGFLLEKTTTLDKAIELLEKSKEIFESLNILSNLAWVFHSLGRAWKLKGEFERSEILLKRSQEISKDEKDLISLAKVLNTLGGVLERQQKWDEAEKILRQSYDLSFKFEDKKGQAIVANSLGQVIANKEGEEAFKISQMYFCQSIKLGEELNDKRHLAKAYTAMGQAFLARNKFVRAVDELSKGFEIDAELTNVRGLKIVTWNITHALIKLGKREEALAYCDRALKISPNNPAFWELRAKIQAPISTGVQRTSIKTGLVLYIRRHIKDNYRWGLIAPDDGSSYIYFREGFIDSESISKLTQGALVEVQVKFTPRGFCAKQIRVIEEED